MTVLNFMGMLTDDTAVIVKDKATNTYININGVVLDSEVIEITAEDNDIVMYIDVVDKYMCFDQSEQPTVNAWDKIFGGCNSWFFDEDDYKWKLDGIDIYGGGCSFDTKEELLKVMKEDITETLICEINNGTLATFVENCDL